MRNGREFTIVVLLLFDWLVVQHVSAQAPGDAQAICSVLAPRPPYPDDWHLLMDSHNYRNLLLASGSVWETRNFDGTGNGFRHGSNSLCGQSVRVCDYSVGASQNNWVFTQHISYDSAREIRIEVSYTLAECRAQSACTTNFVTLHRYDIDQPSSAEQVNTNNYVEFARLDYPPGNSIATTTVTFIRPNARSGFYLGIRDTGTCGSVNQLQVHYLVCPSDAVHLVTYPEVALPPVGVTSPTIDNATCVANAELDTGESSVIRAFHDRQCDFDVSCRCLEGYEENPPRAQNGGTAPATCQACIAGFYRSSLDEVCTACPMNTDQSGAAAPFCPCVSGFFRAAGEGVGFDCTAPPTAVRDLRIVPSRTRQDEVTVRWEVPEVPGRPDFYYTISRSIPGSIGNFLTVDNRLVDADSTVTLRVTNLAPFTDYIIRVAVHNGVTPNDADNDQLRITQVTARTAEGTPGPPSSVQPLCTVVVWGTPAMPNGVITGYELDLGGLPFVTAPADANFIIVPETSRGVGASVRVRARTAVGAGAWSSSVDLGCSGGPQPQCPTVTCPTTVTPSDCPTTPPPTTCPTTVTPSDCPTTPPPTTSGPSLILRGVSYPNNSIILFEDIGEADNALLCMTDREACCSGDDNIPGGWFFPDGTEAVGGFRGGDIYRNRGPQVVRLNRRNGAQSPRGTYRCEIPDASGTVQKLFVTIIESTEPPTTEPVTTPQLVTCPTTETITECPTVSCPTTETPTECPTVTCPTTETPTECPTVTCPTTETQTECPAVTCPTTVTPTECPTVTCPTTDVPTTSSGLSFSLRGVSYPNNSIILFEDIGEANNALLCMTDREACCSGGDNIPGGWFFPNGTEAVGGFRGGDIYRNRGPQIVRLNRRNGAQSPRGTYRCEIPDASGTTQKLFVTLIESTESAPVTCPSTQSPVECPTVTCPQTEAQTDSATVTCPESEPTNCPSVTCPNTETPTDCPLPTTSSVSFSLGGVSYPNNSIILFEDIGEANNALLCTTDREACCSGGDNIPGGWFFPNDTEALGGFLGGDIYRNRGPQVVRLNRRNGAQSPRGTYRCEIPDASGTTQKLFATIIESTERGGVTCPTTEPTTGGGVATTAVTGEEPTASADATIEIVNVLFNIIRVNISEELREGVSAVELRFIGVNTDAVFETQADLPETNLIMIPPDTPLEKDRKYRVEVRPLFEDGSPAGERSAPYEFEFQGFELWSSGLSVAPMECPVVTCPEPDPCPTLPTTERPTTPQPTCPNYQQCTFEYCNDGVNRRSACIMSADGCDGSCQVSNCRTCLSEEYDSSILDCETCEVDDEVCLRGWGLCIRRALVGERFTQSADQFHCAPHPCNDDGN